MKCSLPVGFHQNRFAMILGQGSLKASGINTVRKATTVHGPSIHLNKNLIVQSFRNYYLTRRVIHDTYYPRNYYSTIV